MPYVAPNFGVHERPESGELRLMVNGKLDLASVPLLEKRLDELKPQR